MDPRRRPERRGRHQALDRVSPELNQLLSVSSEGGGLSPAVRLLGQSMTLVGLGSRALDLAVIGNCRTASLQNTQGRLLWWCFPRFDSDPVFSRLLAGD